NTDVPEIDYVNKIMNCFDESALELALRLGDAYKLVDEPFEICALTVGQEKSERILRSALSLGVGKAVRVESEGAFRNNPQAVAAVIEKAVRHSGPYDILLFGMQAGEYDNGQTGLIVAEALQLPCITQVMHIARAEGGVAVTHQTDRGTEVLHVTPPVVLVVGNTEDASLRIPTLKEKLAAREKSIEIVRLSDLGLDVRTLAERDKRKSSRLFTQTRRHVACEWIEGASGREKAQALYEKITEFTQIGR
ncbi:MAG: electron transfer flavoprotein subunit beta/FixA family protein, partial [Synergistales bacterium]|nr:electron transfer flavoprotein subunit beta/FixA family protein [Synergistales bacterium]